MEKGNNISGELGVKTISDRQESIDKCLSEMESITIKWAGIEVTIPYEDSDFEKIVTLNLKGGKKKEGYTTATQFVEWYVDYLSNFKNKFEGVRGSDL